jgi:hypothetical protein
MKSLILYKFLHKHNYYFSWLTKYWTCFQTCYSLLLWMLHIADYESLKCLICYRNTSLSTSVKTQYIHWLTQEYLCYSIVLLLSPSKWRYIYTIQFRPCNLILFYQDSATAGAEKSKMIKLLKCNFLVTASCKWKYWALSKFTVIILMTYTVLQKHKHAHARTPAENKAYLGFGLFYGKCWWYVNLINFHANGIFFTQNIYIMFHCDCMNILQ